MSYDFYNQVAEIISARAICTDVYVNYKVHLICTSDFTCAKCFGWFTWNRANTQALESRLTGTQVQSSTDTTAPCAQRAWCALRTKSASVPVLRCAKRAPRAAPYTVQLRAMHAMHAVV